MQQVTRQHRAGSAHTSHTVDEGACLALAHVMSEGNKLLHVTDGGRGHVLHGQMQISKAESMHSIFVQGSFTE
ncbi:MAG: hypothetical protein QGI77_11085 [Roseibacillus sp.]|nr:hypothetical protein [Roseibacillus sp.]